MNKYKPFVIFPCKNIVEISEGIFKYLLTKTDLLSTTDYGWHFIDKQELFDFVPALLNFFKKHKLVTRDAAITIITSNKHLDKHIDQPPVTAKINFPVLNTEGWANRWYDDQDNLIDEIVDLSQPIVFNSQITHSVEKTTATKIPRIVASFTFYNEPLDLLK